MLVHRVVMPGSPVESWTVLGDDDAPVEPIERYLSYLTAIERSPNTIKAYAHDLKDYWIFAGQRELDWREVRLEDIAEYVAWLRLPPAGRAGAVAVLPSVEPHVGAATINRKLSALAAFYLHQVRHGVDVGELLTTWQAGGGRGGWKPFLHHISKGKPQARRTIAVKVPAKLPRVVTVAEMQAILDACEHLRDRFLFALLYDSGIRIGEALGLRHGDIAAAERQISIVPRINANGARSKSRHGRTIPVSAQAVRLYGDYANLEYGDLDSDYVFVNLFAQPRGQAWSYAAVYDLVVRLRSKVGFNWDPHWCRHAYATRAQVSRIASGASFGRAREHALPAAQRAALRRPRPAGAPCGYGDLGLHGPPGSDATMMRLMPLRGVHHRCACWHRDASGTSRLHRVHHRRSR